MTLEKLQTIAALSVVSCSVISLIFIAYKNEMGTLFAFLGLLSLFILIISEFTYMSRGFSATIPETYIYEQIKNSQAIGSKHVYLDGYLESRVEVKLEKAGYTVTRGSSYCFISWGD